MRRTLLLLALGAAPLLAAGCAVPEPLGAGRVSDHYEVRTDSPEPSFASHVSSAAERAHAALVKDYGVSPGDGFPLCVYRERGAFDEQLSPSLKDRGFVGECGERFALVYWPDDVRGKDTLAHELVHHFNAALIPDLPYWLDEGLAKALAPKRAHGDWLGALARLPEDELRALVRSLPALPDGHDYALRCLVAGALVRFGLDTGGFESVRAVTGWKPDFDRFASWLRGGRPKVATRRFPPVWSGAVGAGP